MIVGESKSRGAANLPRNAPAEQTGPVRLAMGADRGRCEAAALREATCLKACSDRLTQLTPRSTRILDIEPEDFAVGVEQIGSR